MATWNNKVSVVGERPHCKVVATRALRRGETVLQEVPTLTLLHPKQWGLRCNRCYGRAPAKCKLLRCSRCRYFHYCSKSCQRNDWSQHKEECTALSSYQEGGEEPLLAEALLVARVFRLRTAQNEKFRTVMNLVMHPECIQPVHYQIAQLVHSMGLLAAKETEATSLAPPSPKEIVEMLLRFDANNFGIVDELLFFLGAGIYPAGAMLNHSCHHNCAIRYDLATQTQYIQCIVDVNEGDELCHPYIDFACTAKERRTKLRSTYGFDCHCLRCDENHAIHAGWAKCEKWLTAPAEGIGPAGILQVIDESEAWLQQAAASDDILQELDLVQQTVIARSKACHPRHLRLYQARSQLHTVAMSAGKLAIARDQCVEILKTMSMCFYRPEHPLMGVMLYTLGSLHHSLGNIGDAIESYERALPILQSYHGEEHSFTLGCQDYLHQAHQEAG